MIGRISVSGTTHSDSKPENGNKMHSRRGSGLRNRFRTGKSTYSVKRKKRNRDIYGTYSNGKPQSQDIIAGRAMWGVREDK